MADDKKIVKVNKHNTRAKFDLKSFDEKTRTIEVTFATETPVLSYDWETVGGKFIEVLSCDPSHVRTERINNGAPVLDNHDKYSPTRKAVVGVVEWAKFENNTGVAKLRFSNSDDDTDLMNKVKDGIVTGVSVGYDVYAYQLTRTSVDGGLDTYKAIDWEPTEISFVPVQADLNSRTRSESDAPHEATVEDVTPVAEPGTPAEIPAEENTEIVINDDPNTTENTIINTNTSEMTEEERIAAENQTRAAVQKAERERISGISRHARSLGLEQSFADTLIEEGVDLPVAMTRALAEWETKNPFSPKPQADQVEADKGKIRSAMTNALVLRIDPNAATVMGEDNVRAAADFKAMNLLRFAEESLIRNGIRTAGLTPREIAKGALGAKVRGMLHTSDFPLLLGETINRTLLAQYQLQERTFPKWARRATMNDFRTVTRVRVSDMIGDLELVREGGEYKYGTMGEGGESYKLDKYGKIISITWEAIVNDDLSAFTRIPQAFAAKAAQKQSNLVYSVLLDNPVMSDGNTLFKAAHGNFTGTAGSLTAGGTALSEAGLTTAYTLFMNQKAENGDFISVTPKFLIVGPKNAFLAMKMTSANYTPNSQANVPVAALIGLTVIVEPRIQNYEWFLAADPNSIDTVEYAFLDGEQELFIEQREGFDTDGVEVKARMVFATKAIDWRGLYRNNGAVPS